MAMFDAVERWPAHTHLETTWKVQSMPYPPPSMILRLMDSAHGIVANFLAPFSVATRMVGDIVYRLPLEDQICDKEPPATIPPIRTINDLPPELLTCILEYFEDDLSSLKTFSLISRPFLSICRKYLFATLRLNSLGSSFNHQCDTWISLLNHSPDLLSSLRILELGPPIFRLHSRDPIACSRHGVQTMERRVPSIHDQRMQTIMKHALNPQTVIIRFEFQGWKHFSPAFQESIIELIQRETVSSLSLDDVVDFPMVELSRCRHLRDLSLISFNACELADSPGLPGDEVTEGSKGYLESLTLFASDQCIKTMINVLSSPQSLLHLTKLRRLSINSTGSDGRFAMNNIPLVARCLTTLELRVGGQNVGYNICSLGNFPNLRSLVISLSYNRHKRPIQDLAAFLSKSKSTLEELTIIFRHDVPELHLEKTPQNTMDMFQHKDWNIMERTLIHFNLFPGLCKLVLGLRPRDVERFISEHLIINLHLSLRKLMPTLYVMMNPTIEMLDDRFQQFTE